MKRIKKITELIKSIAEGKHSYHILLGGGIIKSSKDIYYDKDKKRFTIEHNIDDTREHYTHKELLDNKISNIGIAMKRGCLICE